MIKMCIIHDYKKSVKKDKIEFSCKNCNCKLYFPKPKLKQDK